MEKPQFNTGKQDEARFNMGIASLMRIDQILKDIKELSMRVGIEKTSERYLTSGNAQHMKFRLVKDLFLNAAPLLSSKEYKDEIRQRIANIVLEKNIKIKVGYNRYTLLPSYNPDIEDELNEIIVLIEERLQEAGMFMPPSDEGSLF